MATSAPVFAAEDALDGSAHENGWSLYRLMQAQQAMDQNEDAEAAGTRMDKARLSAEAKLEGARL